MQQTSKSSREVADILDGINGVVDCLVSTNGPSGATLGPRRVLEGDLSPGSEWKRSILDSSIYTVAGVSAHSGADSIRVECDGFVVIAQCWNGYTIAIMAKMGTPYTKSLARAIRRVRNKVEQPAKVVASTADKALDIRPDNA